MHSVTETTIINASVSDVWKSWDDFANIDRFNPNLSRSFSIDEKGVTGLGARRQCDFTDGRNFVREEIVEYFPEQKMRVDIYNGSLPLKKAQGVIEMRSLGPQQTEISFSIEFLPKMGLLGRLMVPLMKPQFRKALVKVVDGNRAFVESRVAVNAA